jgi:hypothetical protein
MSADETASVSGTLIQGLLEAAVDILGADVTREGLENAPSSAAAAVRNALPGIWVPIADVETVFGALASASGRDLASLHVELARLSVDKAFRTLWRMLLKLTTDAALVSRTPVIFAKSYNRGRLVPQIPTPGRGEVELVDWPNAPEWPIRGTRVGIETVLQIAGRKGVRVEGRRTATGALYVATWK